MSVAISEEKLEAILGGCAEIAEASVMYRDALRKVRAITDTDYLLVDRKTVEEAIAFGVDWLKRFLESQAVDYEKVYGYETQWRQLRFCVKIGGVVYAVEGGKYFGGPYYGLVFGKVDG